MSFSARLRVSMSATTRPPILEWFKSLKPGWQKERQRNFHHGAMERFARGEPDLICDIWTEINRNLNAKLEVEGWRDLTPEEYLAEREVVDYQVMERLRRRVDSIVRDKATAETLKPYYRFLCKRPCSNDDYYETFNRPNVKLIDVSGTQGVERMTEKGFVHNGVEYEVDCIILASGYEITSELRKRWGIDSIVGRDGVSIYDHWAHGFKTLHGMMTHGFPNQFFTGFTQAGLNATNSVTFVSQGRHIGYIVSQALKRGATTVEPSQEAQDAWVKTIRANANESAKQFAQECTPGYFNNEGEKEFRWYLGEPYGGASTPLKSCSRTGETRAIWRDSYSASQHMRTRRQCRPRNSASRNRLGARREQRCEDSSQQHLAEIWRICRSRWCYRWKPIFRGSMPRPRAISCGPRCGSTSAASKKFPRSAASSPTTSAMTRS